MAAPLLERAVNEAKTAPGESGGIADLLFAAFQPYCAGFLENAEPSPVKLL